MCVNEGQNSSTLALKIYIIIQISSSKGGKYTPKLDTTILLS